MERPATCTFCGGELEGSVCPRCRYVFRRADTAAAQRLGGEAFATRPWHQSWWAAAIWIWIPLIFWYGIYVFIVKLTWKQRGATAGTVAGVLATISAVTFALAFFRGSESFLAEGAYEKDVVVLVARSRDISDNFSTQYNALYSDPNLSGASLLAQAKPVFETYRNGMAGLQEQWNALNPPTDALAFHQKASEYWAFELSLIERCLTARSEEELYSLFMAASDDEERLYAELQRLYENLLLH